MAPQVMEERIRQEERTVDGDAMTIDDAMCW